MEKDIYQQNGYENRLAYLAHLADEMDLDLLVVMTLANILGPNEDFDGLVTNLEDYIQIYGHD